MLRYLAARTLSVIPVILGVITLTFIVMHILPGDPASAMLSRSGASAQQVAELRQDLGFDRPFYSQYFYYIGQLLQGDMGKSLASNRPVLEMLAEVIPQTLELVFAAMLIAVPLGTVMGMVAALKQNSRLDTALGMLSAVGVSMPSFWLALVLVLIFSVELGWLPSSGQGEFRHLVLPSLVLAFGAVGTVARTSRTGMVDVLKQDFIRTARAQGKTEWHILWRQALPNALIPVVTIIGLQFGWLLSGSFIVETVFSRQGLGSMLINAILDQDLPLVQGAVLMTSLLYVAINIVVDLVYAWIDPRIRYQ